MKNDQPQIVAFLCNWCAYEGADSAGRARLACPENLKVIRVMCSGRIDPRFVLEAFDAGADGVMILGCPSESCHYKTGNVEALKRVVVLKKVLAQFGIAEDRLRIDWISAKEAQKFVAVVAQMIENVKNLRPFKKDGKET
jgi:F420-non-reducing hydrogenase iron-sulfur subunit